MTAACYRAVISWIQVESEIGVTFGKQPLRLTARGRGTSFVRQSARNTLRTSQRGSKWLTNSQS